MSISADSKHVITSCTFHKEPTESRLLPDLYEDLFIVWHQMYWCCEYYTAWFSSEGRNPIELFWHFLYIQCTDKDIEGSDSVLILCSLQTCSLTKLFICTPGSNWAEKQVDKAYVKLGPYGSSACFMSFFTTLQIDFKCITCTPGS